jgi:hypothetical protein
MGKLADSDKLKGISSHTSILRANDLPYIHVSRHKGRISLPFQKARVDLSFETTQKPKTGFAEIEMVGRPFERHQEHKRNFVAQPVVYEGRLR